MLKDKVAVVYGAGGAIGGAVARAFAREGARVFLAGRRRAPIEAVARDIASAGGTTHVAELDALDEKALDDHLRSVIDAAGRLDISFDAIGIPDKDVVGVPFVELDVEKFLHPIAAYTRSYFLTSRLAARRMVAQKAGVIITLTAIPARIGGPLLGGYSSAMAAKEALMRALSMELAPHGIRTVCLRPHAIPETDSIREVYDFKAAKLMTWEQWQVAAASRTHTRRLTTLAELASTAAFVASDGASGMTGTTVNLTMGHLDD